MVFFLYDMYVCMYVRACVCTCHQQLEWYDHIGQQMKLVGTWTCWISKICPKWPTEQYRANVIYNNMCKHIIATSNFGVPVYMYGDWCRLQTLYNCPYRTVMHSWIFDIITFYIIIILYMNVSAVSDLKNSIIMTNSVVHWLEYISSMTESYINFYYIL